MQQVIARRSDTLTLRERRALGPILPLIDDPALRDILVQVSAGKGAVWADRGGRLARYEGLRPTADEVRALAVALIAAGGRHIDELEPCADVKLGPGMRVHAVLSPIVAAGAAISIRFQQLRRPTFREMVRSGLCHDDLARRLQQAVVDRRNVLVTGATASGKTTLLAGLLDEASEDERIITIEDVQELRLEHPHHIALEARQANSEGSGEVSLERLLREALRMRPDRVVLGECRGPEIVTLLSALNTGHDGGAGTLHANSVRDVPARLEALGALAGLTPEALARQAVSALHLVVHTEQDRGRHRIAAVASLSLDDRGLMRVAPCRW